MPLQLPINNFVTISVTQPGAGLLPYAVNNLLIVSREQPVEPLTLGYGIYRSASDVANDWGSSSEVYDQAVSVFSQAPNILSGGGELIIVNQLIDSDDTETFEQALIRTTDVLGVFYGAAMVCGYSPDDDELKDAVDYGQANRKLIAVVRDQPSAITPVTGIFAQITAAQQNQARLLYYPTTGTPDPGKDSRIFAAAYMSRLLSVDYTGSNTTINMHAKTLVGILPNTATSQTVLNALKTLGADCYPSFGGGGQTLGKVFTSGANTYADLVQNTNWLTNALQVAGFNALAQVGTKIPQTESGMATLKGAYTRVLQQAVDNGFLAPGRWNGPDTFGDPVALIRNVEEAGFYVYSLPIVLQSQANRAARQAPLIQIAAKSAGAINSSNVLVSIEA
jgi:hypothetical protein